MVDAETPKQTILLCEDDESSRKIFARILARAGYNVLTVNNGVECLHTLFAQKIDLLILDLMMHGVDGWDVMHIKENDPRIALVPVIIITGLEARAARNKPLHGAAIILEKPFTDTMLLGMVVRLLKTT